MKIRNAAQELRSTIAVIGGGFSGALTAYHLLRQRVGARVVVIDPRPELGLGLAYSTPSLRHLLNVPAGKISALPDEPDHFLQWLRANHDMNATAATFAPRAVFGRYVQSLLRGITFEQVRAAVVSYRAVADGALLTLDDGSELEATFVVLATGNFDPSELPGISREAVQTGVYRHNAWAQDAFDTLASEAPLTLIGTGLTAVDVLLRLREVGHRGTITAISRHGVLPKRHAPYTQSLQSVIPVGTSATCLTYIRAFRAALLQGMEWRAAVDSLRATTNELWLRLPRKEQLRFRRHLHRRWEVVRHRMAPAIADVIEAEIAAGTLIVRGGSVARVDATPAGARVTIRTQGGLAAVGAARVINCTGPSMNYRRVASPLMESLFSQGAATAGPLGTGFNCSVYGALIGEDGVDSGILFNVGPGRLGNLLESIAIPEIRKQAVQLAAILAERTGQTDTHTGEPSWFSTIPVCEPAAVSSSVAA